MEVTFKDKIYKLDNKKVIYVLSRLTNKNLDNINEDEIVKLMKKYELYDEIFLENINKLW